MAQTSSTKTACDSTFTGTVQSSPISSFIKDFCEYALEIKNFTKEDWIVYILWVGLMLGLVISTTGFVLLGLWHNVKFPAYVYTVPIGNIIFVLAISFDTIGHRTRYKAQLQKAEALVHHITIFAGIASCLCLSIGYMYPIHLKFFILTLIALSIMYSIIDEAFHWHRYYYEKSDRVEMWSHFFIFLGHNSMILAWYHWYTEGYPGVQETLSFMY